MTGGTQQMAQAAARGAAAGEEHVELMRAADTDAEDVIAADGYIFATPENLAAVSGPVAGTDYAVTTFADLTVVFRGLADAVCTPAPPAEVAPEPVPLVPRFTG